MAKGIIYCMTTIVPGLIKIGKTGSNNFEQRMYQLEHNGYVQVVGLKRAFAIEVEDYDEKEALLHSIFSKSNIANTELFALDINLVIQLLSSFEGKQIFPELLSKEEVFENAADKRGSSLVPDGDYYLKTKIKGSKTIVSAKMRKLGSKYIICKGSEFAEEGSGNLTSGWLEARNKCKIENGILVEDFECNSPSMASALVLNHTSNGWATWKNSDGETIDIYRNNK